MLLNKIRKTLDEISTKKRILIVFIAAHTVLLLMMLFTFPRINKVFEASAFDLRTFGYSYDETLVMLERLDTSTRDFYIFPQLLFLDLIYPFLLAFFLSLLIVRLSNLLRLNKNPLYSNIFILPYLAMIVDYIENIMIFKMITNQRIVSEIFVTVASTITQLKANLTMLSWVLILILFVIWLIKRPKFYSGTNTQGK